MDEKQFIKDLVSGKRIKSTFSVKYKHPVREYRNGFMFTAGVADKTGEIEANYWGGRDRDAVQQVYDSFKEGDVVSINGTVGEFKDKLKIDVNEREGSIKRCSPLEYNIEDFVAKTEKDIEGMFSTLMGIIDSVDNLHLTALLDSFFTDPRFSMEFKKAPAAMYIHHAYLGGLLEHTLNVLKLCEIAYSLYPKMDRDLLLLHDIGKMKEFVVTTNIKISEEGMLRGHVVLGDEMLSERIKQIEGFPENLRTKLSHIVLSHHGKSEFSSPKEPQFPEAVAVHYADEYDAKLYQYISAREEATTEDFRTYTKRLGEIYLR
jgi:3'-5' exoribonuclease